MWNITGTSAAGFSTTISAPEAFDSSHSTKHVRFLFNTNVSSKRPTFGGCFAARYHRYGDKVQRDSRMGDSLIQSTTLLLQVTCQCGQVVCSWFNESTNHGVRVSHHLWWGVKFLRCVWGLVVLQFVSLGISKRIQDTCFVRTRSTIFGKANRKRQFRGCEIRIKFLFYCWYSSRVWFIRWFHTQSKRRQRWKVWWVGLWAVATLIGRPDNVEGIGKRGVVSISP